MRSWLGLRLGLGLGLGLGFRVRIRVKARFRVRIAQYRCCYWYILAMRVLLSELLCCENEGKLVFSGHYRPKN